MSVEFVGIELELRGEEGVIRDLQQIDRIINSLGGKKKLNLGMNELKRELVQARGELEKWQRVQKQLSDKGIVSDGVNSKVTQLRYRLKDVQQAIREVQTASRSMGQTFMQTFNQVSSRVAHIGSAMQSMGNALTRLTSPFADFTKGIVMGAGYQALGKFTEGLESGFTRYDTMKKYPKMMAEYSTAAYTAEQSVQDLNKAVDGLPIALDDAVSLAQRYTLSLGDMERGTKLAIATNNAFLASMATDSQRYQGMMQMQDLLNGKDLNSREWMSLGSSMGKAINEIGLRLGYSKNELGKFRQELYAGQISTQDFLKALEEVGTGNGSLVALAKESMDTWEAFFSRIGTAGSRMVYGLLTSLDTLSQEMTGMDVNQLLDQKIIPSIDRGTESIKKWIKAHPEEISEFFETMGNIKWGSIAKGVGEAFLSMARMLETAGKLFGGRDMSWLGKFMIYGNMLGKAFTIIGGVTKGSRHPIATLIATIATLRRAAGKGSIKDALGELLGGKGKDVGEAAKEMSEAGASMGKFSLGLSKWFKGWAQIAVAVGGTAFVGWASFKAFKSMAQDLGEIVDTVKGIDWKAGAASLAAMGGAMAAFIGLGSKLDGKMGLAGLKGEAILGAMTTFASGVFALDMNLIKRGFKSIADATQYINDAIDNLGKVKEIDGSVIDSVKNAIDVFNQITDVLKPEKNNPVFGEGEGGMKGLGFFKTKNIENISKAISAIQKASNNLIKLSGTTIPEGAVDNVKKAVESISEVATAMSESIPSYGANGIAQGTKNIANGLYQMRRIIYSINKIGGMKVSGKGVSNIRTALDEINGAFDGQTIGDLKTKITAFTTSIREALDRFKDFNKPIVIKTSVKLGGGFKPSVSSAVRQIRKAGNDIQAAIDSIPSYLEKQVTVRIVINTIVSGMSAVRGVAAEALAAAGHSTGGTIYRAGGGGVPNFKRRGTDTIPAMLTPGEYVQNKRAVSYFGLDFMRKVNNLDMRGAMNELMAKAGGMVRGNRGTTINNYYNNNQKVTQNINTNSPDFAFRSASRFVGAF